MNYWINQLKFKKFILVIPLDFLSTYVYMFQVFVCGTVSEPLGAIQ